MQQMLPCSRLSWIWTKAAACRQTVCLLSIPLAPPEFGNPVGGGHVRGLCLNNAPGYSCRPGLSCPFRMSALPAERETAPAPVGRPQRCTLLASEPPAPATQHLPQHDTYAVTQRNEVKAEVDDNAVLRMTRDCCFEGFCALSISTSVMNEGLTCWCSVLCTSKQD